MPNSPLSVAQRITVLKNMFADFGIPVLPNSNLDTAIHAEFGPGKRSKVTTLLNDLNEQTDAAKVAACIGEQLAREHKDPKIVAVGHVLQNRLPSLLEIIDVRQNNQKRQVLLSQLIDHFIVKIPQDVQTDRLLRMLKATQTNLKTQMQTQMIGNVAENAGVACDLVHLKRFGKVLRSISPALLALDEPDYPLEQKLNLCTQALRGLAIELRETNLEKSANILENVHWLGRLALPNLTNKASIEHALEQLGVSLGNVSTKLVLNQGLQAGLTSREMMQIIYAGAPAKQLALNAQDLLLNTTENQRYAAICGFLAKIAQDVKQPGLEKVSIAGICLASMRQTLCELKTNNLCAGNFSESLGTILVGAGTITKNSTMSHVGNSILAGVSAYAGIMAVPGGASVAIPLAVCSVLGKLFLDPPKQEADDPNLSKIFSGIVNEILALQNQMRQEFANLSQELQMHHSKTMHALDQGFASLSRMLQCHNAQVLNGMHDLKQDLQDLHHQIDRQFSDLYLEYVHEPLEEVDYARRYGSVPASVLQKNQHKLGMWLLYKSKHPKVNGLNANINQLASLSDKLDEGWACLALINRYINHNFAFDFPQDLPHIPTWIKAAEAYALLSTMMPEENTNDAKFLEDVIAMGNQMQSFVEELATNTHLWSRLNLAMQALSTKLWQRWHGLKQKINQSILQDFNSLVQGSSGEASCFAQSGGLDNQLEAFAPINVDITRMWHEQIRHHIPQEIFAATKHGLGNLKIQFFVDKTVNTFADLRIANGNILPDHGRDVLFKVIVNFEDQKTKDLSPLITLWVAYDLQDAKQRMCQYYKPKFKHALRHSQYNWISLDGRANQVEGHGDTTTNKKIDFDQVGQIYRAWLQDALPINNPDIMARLKHNPLFYQQYEELLTQGNCVILHHEQMARVQACISNELRTFVQQKRYEYATMLQQDPILNQCLQKLDVFNAITDVYMRLLNKPHPQCRKFEKFNELLSSLQESTPLNVDIIAQLEALFRVEPLVFAMDEEYRNGEFYCKMNAVLARLGLLQAKQTFERLQAA